MAGRLGSTATPWTLAWPKGAEGSPVPAAVHGLEQAERGRRAAELSDIGDQRVQGVDGEHCGNGDGGGTRLPRAHRGIEVVRAGVDVVRVGGGHRQGLDVGRVDAAPVEGPRGAAVVGAVDADRRGQVHAVRDVLREGELEDACVDVDAGAEQGGPGRAAVGGAVELRSRDLAGMAARRAQIDQEGVVVERVHVERGDPLRWHARVPKSGLGWYHVTPRLSERQRPYEQRHRVVAVRIRGRYRQPVARPPPFGTLTQRCPPDRER